MGGYVITGGRSLSGEIAVSGAKRIASDIGGEYPER